MAIVRSLMHGAAWLAVLCTLGCPKPVVPPPPPVDRPSKEVETILDDALAAWATAHAHPSRGEEYRAHLSRAIEFVRRADAQGGGRNGLAKTLLAKLVFELDGAAGIPEAVRLATAACAEDKGFAPAFLVAAELQLSRRQGEMTAEALAKADRDLKGAFHAIAWLERGGRIGEPWPEGSDFYAGAMTPPEEMVERLRVIERFLAFDLGNDGAVPTEVAMAAGGGARRSPSSLAAPGAATIGRLKARHRLASLSLELAGFDLDGTPVKPTLLADYRRILDEVLGKLDPDCFEAKYELAKVQYRLATELPTRTDDTWLAAHDLAKTMLEYGGVMVRNEPRVRVLAYRVFAGYAEFRVSRFVALGDETAELASRGALYETVENLTAALLGPPGAVVVKEPEVAVDLLAARLGYDLSTLEFFARFARRDAGARAEYERNRIACEQRFADLHAVKDELDARGREAVDRVASRLRQRFDAALATARES